MFFILCLLIFCLLCCFVLPFAVVFFKSTIYSIFSLICVYFIAFFFLLLLGAEYLAFSVALVCIGAISVLFLVIVFMLGSGMDVFFSYSDFSILEISLFVFFNYKLIESLSECVLSVRFFFCKGLLLSGRGHGDSFTWGHNYFFSSSSVEAIKVFLYSEFCVFFLLLGVILFLSIVASIILYKYYE